MNIVNNDHDHRGNYIQMRGLIDMLLDLPDWVRAGTVAEIGAFTGDSTQLLSLAFKNVITIDPIGGTIDYSGLDAEAIYNKLVLKIARKNILHIRKRSDDAVEDVPAVLTAVYIDGSHLYERCFPDIKHYWNKLVDGGYMCGHDYMNPLTTGVTRAVQEAFGEPDNYYIDWSWSVKKVEGRIHVNTN
jgi:hypothetical protein